MAEFIILHFVSYTREFITILDSPVDNLYRPEIPGFCLVVLRNCFKFNVKIRGFCFFWVKLLDRLLASMIG